MTSACMYDAVKLFCTAMEETQSTEWEDINNWLHTVKDYQGVTSTYSYNGNPMLSTSEFVVQIEGDSAEVVALVKS